MAPFTLKLVKIENGGLSSQPSRAACQVLGSRVWLGRYWRAHSRTLPGCWTSLPSYVDGSLGHLCPTTDLSAVSSHPLHSILLMVARCLLCRSSEISYDTPLPEHFCWRLTCGLCPSAQHMSPPLLHSPLRLTCLQASETPFLSLASSLLAVPPPSSP